MHVDVSSQIVTKVTGPEGLEYFWRQLCHLNPLHLLCEGSTALSYCLLLILEVGRKKACFEAEKSSFAGNFFPVFFFIPPFFINTCSGDVVMCKITNSIVQASPAWLASVLFIYFTNNLSGHMFFKKNRLRADQNDTEMGRCPGVYMGRMPWHHCSEKSMFFEDFWVMAKSCSHQNCPFI